MVVVETPSEGKPLMGKSNERSAVVTRDRDSDLAKNVLQAHGVDAKGDVVLAPKISAQGAVAFRGEACAVRDRDGGLQFGASLGA